MEEARSRSKSDGATLKKRKTRVSSTKLTPNSESSWERVNESDVLETEDDGASHFDIEEEEDTFDERIPLEKGKHRSSSTVSAGKPLTLKNKRRHSRALSTQSVDLRGRVVALERRSRANTDEIKLSRKILASWLSRVTGLRVRSFSDEAFLNDLRDGIALCMALDSIGWVSNECATAVHISTHRHTLPRSKKRENLRLFHKALQENDCVLENQLPRSLEDFHPDLIESILPGLMELMGVVEGLATQADRDKREQNHPTDDSVKDQVREMQEQVGEMKEVKEEVTRVLKREIPPEEEAQEEVPQVSTEQVEAGEGEQEQDSPNQEQSEELESAKASESNVEEKGERKRHKIKAILRTEKERSRSRRKAVLSKEERKKLEEAANSVCAVLIFLVLMFMILSFVGDIIGLTDIGFASMLGLRKRAPAIQEISWYTDMRRPW